MSSSAMVSVPRRLAALGNKPSVWLEFTPLAAALRAINLGQGFPDWEPPEWVVAAATRAATDAAPETQQYARSRGHPRLLRAIADLYRRVRFPKQRLDPNKNVLVTNGASGALYLTLSCLVDEGDEVVVFEPTFDIYLGAIRLAGGIPRCVPLKWKGTPREGVASLATPNELTSAADWSIDWDALCQVLGPRTRVLMINTPHNPLGKVLTRTELERLAEIIRPHPQLTVLSDEVYEHILFDGCEHISFGSLEGMFERSVSIFSAGKTFSVTGWKIGWIIGPESHIQRFHNAQQFIVFSVCTPMQAAVAECLEEAQRRYYFSELASFYQRRRDQLVDALFQSHLEPIVPQGGYFVVASFEHVPRFVNRFPEALTEMEALAVPGLEIDDATRDRADYNFARWLSFECGITPIPLSAFYCADHANRADALVRFAFCKQEQILEEASRRLHQLQRR
ncbi:hypothetical protein CCYA_CCYA14G3846 [Cyanidiococcus yangmingshanensis]|nr:hypothetical protein CCYA_CCYA14G3846 [Cyanidiococcus yangmingshanensis]